MKCPVCSEEMIMGTYRLKKPVIDIVNSYFDQGELFFDAGKKNSKVTLGVNDIKRGHYCSTCFTQLILIEQI
jgi:hypothetical protein